MKQIFILSGQSNMSGRGGVHNRHWDGIIPPQCSSNAAQVLRFSASSAWAPAAEPLHADIDTSKTCGVGPGMSFANSFLTSLSSQDSSAAVLGLVPCAVGGTAIAEWEKGCKLYENMVRRAKESVGDGGEIKAVLWYQGESDTNDHHHAVSYEHNLRKLIQNVREDLCLPDLPFIQVALASGGSHKYIEIVREAQLGLKMHNVVCVDAKGLKLNADNLHLTAESQVSVGDMLAKAYISDFLAVSTD